MSITDPTLSETKILEYFYDTFKTNLCLEEIAEINNIQFREQFYIPVHNAINDEELLIHD